jgi:hypothetical protein
MQLLAFREYPAIDAQTLVEFIGHEPLFREADGSFLLHMSSEGQPVTEERIVWLSARCNILAQRRTAPIRVTLGVR